MKKRKNSYAVTVILSFALISFPALSFGESTGGENWCEEKGEGRKDGWKQKLFDETGVTEEQKKQLAEHRKESRSLMKELHRKKEEARVALKKELQKEVLDMGKINSISSDLKTLSADVVTRRLDGFLAMRKVLTYEQFNKMMEWKNQHKGKKGNRSHKNRKRSLCQE